MNSALYKTHGELFFDNNNFDQTTIFNTVIFDWNGVLSTSTFFEGYIEQLSANLLRNTMFANLDLIKLWMRGDVDYHHVCQWLASQTDINQDSIEAALILSVQNFVINQQLLKIIDGLRVKKIKVIMHTDNMDVFEHFLTANPMITAKFDHIYNSSDIKILKKDNGMDGIKYVWSHAQCKPDSTLFIDDVHKTGQLFESLGGKFFWFDPGNSEKSTDKLQKYLKNYT